MEKAFDLKVLGEKLKAKGLDLAEEALKVIAVEGIAWIEESAAIKVAEGQPVFSILVPVLEAVKPAVLEAIDKVDGKVG